MRKFTLIIAFIAMASFVFGQRVNMIPFTKKMANITKTMHRSKAKNTNPTKPGTVIWGDNFTTTSNWTLTHATGTTANWSIGTTLTSRMSQYMAGGGQWTAASGNFAKVDAITSTIAAGNGVIPAINAFLTFNNTINTQGYNAVAIKFNQLYKSFNADTSYVQFSLDGGSTWPISCSVNPKFQVASNTFGPDTIYLIVPQIANQASVMLRFWFLTKDSSMVNLGGGYGWAIDNIQLIEPITNDLIITGYHPSFDNPCDASTFSGFYRFYPATCPTRIFNNAIIKNNGANTQTGTKLTVSINDPYSGNYLKSSDTSTILSGVTNDTLKVGYYDSSGYTIPDSNVFYLNFNNTYTGAQQPIINQQYMINYSVTSNAMTTPTTTMVDSFEFYVGKPGNPYTGALPGYVGPDLEYAFARANQNPVCDETGPQMWLDGGTNNDGIYSSFVVWDQGGTNAIPTVVNYMEVFISDGCSFDQTLHNGSTIQGIIYSVDLSTNPPTYSNQIQTNSYTLTPADTGHFIQLAFLQNHAGELLSGLSPSGHPGGTYIFGIEISYNNDTCFIGEDGSFPQSPGATFWNIISSGNGQQVISNYGYTPMMNLSIQSNPLAIKHVNDNNIVNVYPNPTSGLVNIVAPENSSIKVYNLLGINVTSIEHSSTLNHLDLSGFPDGNYIVKVINGKNVTTKKLNLIK